MSTTNATITNVVGASDVLAARIDAAADALSAANEGMQTKIAGSLTRLQDASDACKRTLAEGLNALAEILGELSADVAAMMAANTIIDEPTPQPQEIAAATAEEEPEQQQVYPAFVSSDTVVLAPTVEETDEEEEEIAVTVAANGRVSEVSDAEGEEKQQQQPKGGRARAKRSSRPSANGRSMAELQR